MNKGHQSDESSERGWIKLWRKLKDHPRYGDSEYVHVWTELLLSATHKPHRAIFNGKTIWLQPGQLIAGRHAIAKRTGVNSSKVNRVLGWMKSEQQIEQQPGNKNSIITVLNWQSYQNSEQQNEQQPDRSRTASEQQPNTNKNVEKGKKERMKESFPSTLKAPSEFLKSAGSGQREQELVDRCFKIFGKDAMATYGGSWRNRARENPSKLARVLDQVQLDQKEGKHIRFDAAYANDLWQRFAG